MSHAVFTRRFQVTEDVHAFADASEVIQSELYAGRVRDGNAVECRVISYMAFTL